MNLHAKIIHNSVEIKLAISLKLLKLPLKILMTRKLHSTFLESSWAGGDNEG